ncbi:uncharacterized protein M6B38_286410 [Iris pallida]|uniref:Uncharacterized protein n=1 Tax=Iris pallida TaxID=29817 RepID=A0AAX6HX36_IRIPA|nr:uncharacterized protein M6B38_286410 [Iris pallida]
MNEILRERERESKERERGRVEGLPERRRAVCDAGGCRRRDGRLTEERGRRRETSGGGGGGCSEGGARPTAPVVVREQRGGVEGTGELRRAVGLLGGEDLAMGGSHAADVAERRRSGARPGGGFGAAGGKRSSGWASTWMASGLGGGVGRRSPGCGRWSWQLRRSARRPSEVRLGLGFFLFFRCLVVVVFLVAAVLSSGEVAGRGVQ